KKPVFKFFNGYFVTTAHPIASQTSAIVCPNLLSLSTNPGRLPKPEMGFQHHQKSQKMLNPVHLVQKSLGQGSGLPTMKPCCFRANARHVNLIILFRVGKHPVWNSPF